VASINVVLLSVSLFGVIAAMIVGPPYLICRNVVGFIPFIALPMGSLIPFILSVLITASISPWVVPAKQQGYGFTSVLSLIGAMATFAVLGWVGAFYFLDEPNFWSRFMWGLKIGAVPAGLIFAFILYLGFLE